MNIALVVFVVVISIALGVVPWIVGTVIARRASNRWHWPEAHLMFLAFLAVPVLLTASIIALPLIGWLMEDSVSFEVFNWIVILFRLAGAIPVVVIAIALYRLANRARQTETPSLEPIDPPV